MLQAHAYTTTTLAHGTRSRSSLFYFYFYFFLFVCCFGPCVDGKGGGSLEPGPAPPLFVRGHPLFRPAWPRGGGIMKEGKILRRKKRPECFFGVLSVSCPLSVRSPASLLPILSSLFPGPNLGNNLELIVLFGSDSLWGQMSFYSLKRKRKEREFI